MIFFSSVVLGKNKITSTIEHVYTARCSLFKSLTRKRKNSPWNWCSLVALAMIEPESVLLWGGRMKQLRLAAMQLLSLNWLVWVKCRQEVCMTGYT